jgi:hypothetical protein
VPQTTTAFAAPNPFYRLTLEGGNYYSFGEISSPDCVLSVVEASSEVFSAGNLSAFATVDGDAATCFGTPEADMSIYGPTYIVYECAARTRRFDVDTVHRCGGGPVTSYTIEWSIDSDGSGGDWRPLDALILPATAADTIATTSTTDVTTTQLVGRTTERVDKRAKVRVFSAPDCTGPGEWGAEAMDLCYYGVDEPASVEILQAGVWVNTYRTCFYLWDEQAPGFLQSFSTPGCHNFDAVGGALVGGVEVVSAAAQACAGGFGQGHALLSAGIVLVCLYVIVALCPPVYYAARVLQTCTPKDKQAKIVFRD